jgi:hypothetical protein
VTDEELDAKVRQALGRTEAPVKIDAAETVNLNQPASHVPHSKWLMWLTVAILSGYTGVTCIVLLNNYDGLTKGAIIATWTNMAFGAFGFWLGSSSAGKAQAKS